VYKRQQQFNRETIKKIIPLEEDTEQYVYDLETENHHFQAGIGQMIVHNTDGLHITGLLYNFFDVLFPTLVRTTDFFYFMRVPILKITERNKTLDFYFYKEAQKYIQEKKPKNTNIRYFKGLGTSNNDDVKNDFGKKLVHIACDSKESEEQVNKIFSKDFTDFRKEWIANYDDSKVMSSSDKQINVKDFLDNELITFSIEDCKRSIPHVLDGLKDSQRKVLYSAIKKGLNYKSKSLKVAQFAGYIAEQTNYHHGEQNLYETITKMAQRFVGSNNIPLLFNDGQFGERYENGEDAANGRYIFTKLDKLTRLLFREEDDDFLQNVVEDGDVIEKKYYLPIVPMILINGNSGIGTGWSSHVCCYSIKNIINWITCWIDGEDEFPVIAPHYNNFKGSIKTEGTRIKTTGVLTKKKDKEYVITEIPLGKKNMSISKYKESLEALKEEGVITSINDQSSENDVNFTIKLSEEMEEGELLNKLGLEDCYSTNNMVLFDKKDGLKKYEKVEGILEYFCQERLALYKTRREGIIASMKNNLKILRNKERFVSDVVHKKLEISNLDEDDTIFELEKRKYDKKEGKFEYLLSMQMRQMTKTKIEELQKEIVKCEEELKAYEKLTEKEIWKSELKELQKEL
jgi:DNA topoisomerase-2